MEKSKLIIQSTRKMIKGFFALVVFSSLFLVVSFLLNSCDDSRSELKEDNATVEFVNTYNGKVNSIAISPINLSDIGIKEIKTAKNNVKSGGVVSAGELSYGDVSIEQEKGISKKMIERYEVGEVRNHQKNDYLTSIYFLYSDETPQKVKEMTSKVTNVQDISDLIHYGGAVLQYEKKT